jgi:hypothetical protein
VVIAPLQTFGIGDILYCMPIFDELIKQGHKILWGVEPQFLSIAKHFPNVTFVDRSVLNLDYRRNDEYFIGNMKVIPLRFTDSILNVPYNLCMQSKYLYFGKEFNEWRKLKWVRDYDNEEKLFFDVLKLTNFESYNFINRTFRMNNSGYAKIAVDNGLRNIEMQNIEGFSLLDWAMVIENATHIHTVSTSTFYVMEILDLKATEINLYLRKPDEKNFDNISYLCTKNYILHGN